MMARGMAMTATRRFLKRSENPMTEVWGETKRESRKPAATRTWRAGARMFDEGVVEEGKVHDSSVPL